MTELNAYISALKSKSHADLRKEYNIDNFEFCDFELINFFLLDQAMAREQNLFVKTLSRNQKKEIYLPTIISIAVSLFFKNYCINSNTYKIGDVLQRDGVRYKISKIKNGKYDLDYFWKGNPTKDINLSKEKLDKKYLKINSPYSNRKVKIKLTEYKKIFQSIFCTEDFPSKFRKKAIMIIEKKDFLKELKSQTNTNEINLSKAIPYQWVNKNGKFESTPIPIDPMIYLVPDYATFKEFIIDSDIEIDAVISVGKNKYQPDIFRMIKRDLREEKIPFAILIGSEEIEDNANQFLKWRWTIPEIIYFQNCQQASISTIREPDNKFTELIEKIGNYITHLNQEFDIQLTNFNIFKKMLYSLVFPKQESRLNKQLDYLAVKIDRVYSEEIDAALFNQNLNSGGQIEELKRMTTELTTSFLNSKFSTLKNQLFDYIVIPELPKDAAEIWKMESKLKTLSHKQFLKKIEKEKHQKIFIFLSPFGYGFPQELFNLLQTTFHKYQFLTYEKEELAFEQLKRNYENSIFDELNSIDRKTLTGLDYPQEIKTEQLSDLINRIDHKNEESQKNEFHNDEVETVNYKIKFENGENLILNGNKSVLLIKGEQNIRIKISSLIPGDKIRIYLNYSKELLYETAKKQDEHGCLAEIEEHSKLWKECLRDYDDQRGLNFSDDDLLSELQENNVSIKSHFTLKNWLNPESNVKFPQRQQDLHVINRVIENDILHKKLPNILKSRRRYAGIMIALGRDLSDEIVDYIMSKNKGPILNTFSTKEIESLISISAPLRTVKNIQVTDEDESE